MKIQQLLLILQFVFAIKYLFKGALGGCVGSSTTLEGKCQCEKYDLNQFNVYHAYNRSRNMCFALKSCEMGINGRDGINREILILSNLNRLNPNARNHIIKMEGHELKDHGRRMYIVLELGGETLMNYFHQKIEESGQHLIMLITKENEVLLTKILLGAAQPLQQFHQHGIHLDVKEGNFVVSLEQSQDESVIECKLIDFNTSVLFNREGNIATNTPVNFRYLNKTLMAPEIQDNGTRIVTKKSDVYSFGLMAFQLFYLQYFTGGNRFDEVKDHIEAYLYKTDQYSLINYTRLDRPIKACFQDDPDQRPSMNAIVSFLKKRMRLFLLRTSAC
uniref:Protein kinase domain-containing protein n=1 Tax=Meloidogyne enterolobii TaxID=390850 RepID=A0A6V7TWC2_MELEN|nr:unnamed protein product [Meloidogyne enterolobii]